MKECCHSTIFGEMIQNFSSELCTTEQNCAFLDVLCKILIEKIENLILDTTTNTPVSRLLLLKLISRPFTFSSSLYSLILPGHLYPHDICNLLRHEIQKLTEDEFGTKAVRYFPGTLAYISKNMVTDRLQYFRYKLDITTLLKKIKTELEMEHQHPTLSNVDPVIIPNLPHSTNFRPLYRRQEFDDSEQMPDPNRIPPLWEGRWLIDDSEQMADPNTP